ncbi:MAG: condensation domain-containing protein, partial [Polyangiaceae bacterium]
MPSHLRALLHASDPARALPAHALIVGGEASDWALVEQVQRLKPGCRIINHYGPTETTVGVSTFELGGARPDGASLPIGHALPGAELLVLDRDLNRLPAGTAGELYIGGARLARGYGKSPALTAERFVPDPFGTSGGRLYRTGDRVRQSASGELEFLGRMDRQVKIRGYRIELGEIEARLAAHPALRQAVVLTRASSGGTLQLAAYVVGDGTPSLPDTLQAYLAGIFPDYMLPSRIIALRELPLTPNGKLDRQALPWDEPAATPAAAPASDITANEQHLLDVWKEVLRVEHVAVDDNFFRLGGDSILSLQVIARARRRGLRITPKQLFDQQTVRELARVATRVEAKATAPAAPASESTAKEVPLLPLQTRFFEQRLPELKRYTQSLLLTPREPLRAAVLERALGAVVAQHEALALGFDEVEPGRWRARRRAAANGSVLWLRSAADERALQPILDEALADFDLAAGSLLRIVLIDLASGGQRLFAVAHHLVVDGVSWRVLLEELESAYRQLAGERPVSLPERTAAPSEWAERLRAHAGSDDARQELDFWCTQLGDVTAAPATPRSTRWHSSELVLEREATRQLLSEAPEAYRTEINDLLLTALVRALCRTSGQKSATLMLEGHGREPLFDDVDPSRTVGWLTSVFPLRLRPKLTGDGALGASIKAIKQQLRSVPRRGIGYCLLRHAGDAATRARLTALHEPGITFNYLGQLDQSFEPAGLFEPAGVGARAGDHSVDAALSGSLAINAQVYGGELRVAIAHDPALHDAAAITALREAFEAELHAVIEHTTGGASGATPADFPLIGLEQAELDALPLVWHEIEDLYPLTPMQEGLLMHTLLEPGTGIYLMQHDHRIEDTVDVDAFRRAWQHVAEEYDVLRTAYVWNEGGMLQAVHKSAVTDSQFHDLRAKSEAEREAALNAMLEDELAQGFDLARLPLWRVRLLRMGERSFRFVY